MKTFLRSVVTASLLFTVAAVAQNTNGQFQFAREGASGAIQFEAHGQGNGAAGEMTFVGNALISNDDVDGNGKGAGEGTTKVTFHATFDCMQVKGNQAAMGGVVTSSSIQDLVGTRVLLAVEDNGNGPAAPPSRFTWGLYRSSAKSWTPYDAERPDDAGAMYSWYATDAERPEQPGVSSVEKTSVDCSSFPFGSYAFEQVPTGGGTISVK